uniref:ARAD1D21824p n=1 Tax=Blastobotrys adeninivorans TaxID=409370 RepID=A0A060TGA3_BLAAD
MRFFIGLVVVAGALGAPMNITSVAALDRDTLPGQGDLKEVLAAANIEQAKRNATNNGTTTSLFFGCCCDGDDNDGTHIHYEEHYIGPPAGAHRSGPRHGRLRSHGHGPMHGFGRPIRGRPYAKV